MAVPAQERLLRVALLGAGVMLLGALSSLAPPANGPRDDQATLTATRALLALVPLVPLIFGLRSVGRNALAAPLLLFAVPASLVLAQPLSATRLDPIVFSIWAAALVGYIVQSARLVEGNEPYVAIRVHRTGEAATRLRRRSRVYDALLGLTIVAFALPLVRALTSGGAGLPVIATAGLLAVLASRAFLLDPLDRHLQRDPGLEETLATLRRHARRGRPANTFYVVALVALIGMALFVMRNRLGS